LFVVAFLAQGGRKRNSKIYYVPEIDELKKFGSIEKNIQFNPEDCDI